MSQIKTKFIEDSAINSNKIASSAVTTAKIADDAVTGAKIRLDNNEMLTGRNQANSADVSVLKVNTSDQIEFGLLPYGPNSNAPVADAQLANKKYVDDEIANVVSGTEWQDSVIDKDLTSPPGSPTTGDRYLLGTDTTANLLSGAWASHDGEIAEYNGSTWDFTAPTTGMAVLVDDESTVVYRFGTTTWASHSFEATTASTGLVKVGLDIRLDSSAAGDGLGFSSGVLSVNTDDVTIEKSGDALRVKDLGISTAKLANNSVTEGKLDSGVDAETFLIASGYTAGAGTVTVGDSIQAAIQKVEGKVDAIIDSTPAYEAITLNGTDITNQYIDLAAVAETHSIHLQVAGGPVQRLTSDYTISYTGGAGGNTRISFAGDLATGGNAALVATDVVLVRYLT